MSRILNALIIGTVLFALGCASSYPGIGTRVTEVATGFKFTEGPALAPNGDIYFSDIHACKTHIWSTRGKLSTFREDTGRANGLLFDSKGNLLFCEGGNRRVTRMSPDGKLTVIADKYDGKKLNSPNDLWEDPKGGIYFTDPRYWKQNDLEQDGMHVYYLPPDGGTLKRVINDMVKPNGIIGTPDGKTLYVADHGGWKTYKYRIEEDGSLSGKTLFAEARSDGMTLNSKGTLYLTTDTVMVYSPKGKLIRTIKIPQKPTNVCFGKDGKTLFITARKSLYAVRIEQPE